MKFLTDISITLYLIAFILSILNVYKTTNKIRFFFNLFSISAFLIHTISIIMRYYDIGTIPITNMHESSSFFAWSVFVIFLYLHYRYRFIVLGTFILPIVILLMVTSSLLYSEIRGVSPVLQSYWLIIHTVSAFTGNASFAVAAGIGVMYQLQERFLKKKKMTELFNKLPSVQILDEINYRLITIGFPLHTLAIISGALWSESSFGIFWRWDPKEVWALITWLIYATILHLRLVKGWRGRKSALLSVIGFLAVLFTYFGVNLFMESYHTF
ncbi:MAG: c-type cytochrome biogenesis protein CcsB [Thermodesulfovibrionales bacterium]|nr:c-type cytochrome biogenesis protein CcsB [Thermodesulfovibrionales bacterium]